MVILYALLASAAAGLCIATVYVAGHLRGWWVERLSVDELADRLDPHIEIHRPDGPGPFPAVLQMHGCGGVKEIQRDYARVAARNGVLAVILDSHAPRGISYREALRTVCKGRRLLGAERAGDLIAGLRIIRRMGDVDATRLAVAGWSHGAWAVMDALALRAPDEAPFNLQTAPDDAFDGLQGAYLVYPYCGFPSLTRKRGWTTLPAAADMLLVDGDTRSTLADGLAAAERARASGAHVETEIWTGVTHAFDEQDQEPGSGLVFDPEAAERAHARYAGWLQRTLSSGPTL